MFWLHISSLGGLHVTALIALAITVWLVSARCWRLALAWCLLFGAMLAFVSLSQMAFIGWGIGVRSLDFTGFSGHASRAAAVYPVAAFLLLERRPDRLRWLAVAGAALLGVAVAIARVKIGAHSPSEAVLGLLVGLATAALFMRHAYFNRRGAPRPLLIGLGLAMFLLPHAGSATGHQWLIGMALNLAGHDRPYQRGSWQQARHAYRPPCSAEKVHFSYLCT